VLAPFEHYVVDHRLTRDALPVMRRASIVPRLVVGIVALPLLAILSPVVALAFAFLAAGLGHTLTIRVMAAIERREGLMERTWLVNAGLRSGPRLLAAGLCVLAARPEVDAVIFGLGATALTAIIALTSGRVGQVGSGQSAGVDIAGPKLSYMLSWSLSSLAQLGRAWGDVILVSILLDPSLSGTFALVGRCAVLPGALAYTRVQLHGAQIRQAGSVSHLKRARVVNTRLSAAAAAVSFVVAGLMAALTTEAKSEFLIVAGLIVIAGWSDAMFGSWQIDLAYERGPAALAIANWASLTMFVVTSTVLVKIMNMGVIGIALGFLIATIFAHGLRWAMLHRKRRIFERHVQTDAETIGPIRDA